MTRKQHLHRLARILGENLDDWAGHNDALLIKLFQERVMQEMIDLSEEMKLYE